MRLHRNRLAALVADTPETDRHELLDELATGIATDRLRALKLDYRNHRVVAGGRVPHSGGGSASDMFSLLASYSILNAARALATERVTGAVAPDDPRIDDGVRKLILTEDFFVMQRVVKYVREALESLEDAELAALIAAKRLGDYKASL